ncbi:MAG: aldehyde dehydrogenase [Roseburia sp.]|nr:aldehyde dehydrogenase [Roseburia sp.]
MSMLETIIASQREYFKAHKALDVKTRIAYLKKLKAAIQTDEAEICDALKADLGKSANESYMAEIGMVLEDLGYHIKHLKKWVKPKRRRSPLAQFPSKSYILPSPRGNVLIISPWNYPFLLSMQPLVGAIAAGNTVVLKPSRSSAATSAVMTRIIEQVFPPELAVSVYGDDQINAEVLTYKFDYIFFTGGKDVGQKVYEAASKFLTPVTLELGGKSPVVVDSTAKIALAAKRIVFGKFLNVGQTCVAPDYVIAHTSIADKLVENIKAYINKLYPDALGNDDYGKIINTRHYERVKGLISDNVACGGNFDDATRKIEPTVLYPATLDDAAMKEEIFGPVLPVLTYSTDEELAEIIDKNPQPLAFYLFTSKRKAEKTLLPRTAFGGGCVNDVVIHLASTQLPFGGVGGSGMGSYHGKKSFETFSHFKSVLKKSNVIDLPFRYTPYTKGKDKLIRFFLK